MSSNDWGGDGMSPAGHAPTEKRTETIRKAFHHMQNVIGEGNAQRGFHDEGDWVRHRVRNGNGFPRDTANLRNYYMMKVALIMSEGAEALEELRSGRRVDRNWYSIDGEVLTNAYEQGPPLPTADGFYTSRETKHRWEAKERTPKPEGVPSEIADIVIRCFDFADEAGFSLIEAILEKLAYNATRSHMHGRQV